MKPHRRASRADHDRTEIVRTMKRQGRKWTWLAEQTSYSRTHVFDMVSGRAAMSPRFVKLARAALGIEQKIVA